MMKNWILIILFFVISSYANAQIESAHYLEDAAITSITGENGDIWVSTYGQGIYEYSAANDEWKNYSTDKENALTDFYYSIAVSDKYVWAGGVDGLYTFDRTKGTWYKRKFALGGEMGNWIRALCYDPDQNVLWIGRFENLTRYDVKRRRFADHVLTRNNDVKTNNFKSISLDGDSLVWFGTEGGLYKYYKKLGPDDPKAWQFITNKQGGFGDEGETVSVTGVIPIGMNVWIGTDEFITAEHPKFNLGGLFKFNRRFAWRRFSERDGLQANGINCIARTGNFIWTSVYDFNSRQKKQYGKGLSIINRITGDVFPIDLNDLKINSSNITALYFDGTNLWIGTDKGLTKLLIANPLAEWQGENQQ